MHRLCLTVAALMILAGCGTNAVERGVTGAAIGAGTGAAAGALIGPLGVGAGALIGAGAGGATGLATDARTVNLGTPVWRWGE
jgi:hypothetical protein